MKNMPPTLDFAAFEIRYGSGHLYLDRCGQCFLDIERECPGWTMTAVSIKGANLENPDKSLHANFNSNLFAFTAQKASRLNIEEIAKEICGLWKIIQANLGLDEFPRIGFRLSYLLPTASTEEADRRLNRSEINIVIPETLKIDGYNIKNRQLIVVLEKDGTEYRVELTAVTRHEGLAPSDLVRTDSRLLSKKQNEFRMAKLKQMAEYSANPMFGVNLNIDCVGFYPSTLMVEEFILKQARIIDQTFLPVLKKL